jgi:hypothetical protein
MSFSWSTSSTASFAGLKPATTNSFADALKRLAEHVEEKNKNSEFTFSLAKIDTDAISTIVDANNGETSALVQSSTDFPNRINPSYVNNSIPPEQALRLYTQYIQEVFVAFEIDFKSFNSRQKDEKIYDDVIFDLIVDRMVLILLYRH